MSMLTTTQGVIADDLEAYESVTWFTSAYLVSMSSLSPLAGKLSYVIAPRFLMFFATIILGIGSLISGFAKSLAIFLLGRALSGVGAAGLLSVSIVLVIQLTSQKRRGLAVGLINSAFTVGVAAGAIIAGALELAVGWRFLFWIQCPISIAAGACLVLSIPKHLSVEEYSTTTSQKTPFEKAMQIDYLGALLLVLCIVSLLVGLSTPQISAVPILFSLALFPIFLYQEIYRHPDPIIPVSILGSRGALLCCISTVGFMMARWSVLFYTPIFATAVRGWHPAKAGSLLVPTNAGFAIGSIASGGIHIRRAGSWYISTVVIYAIFPITLFALALVSTATSPTWMIVVFTFANGLCAGASLNYVLHHCLHLVLPEVRFIITSLLATFRGFSGTFGSAIGGGIFIRVLSRSLDQGFEDHGLGGPREKELIRRLVGSPRAVQGLIGYQRDIAIASYTKAVQSLFFSGVALSLVMLLIQALTGSASPTTTDSYENIDHDDSEETEVS
jgi:predicted MFS family arabinose efflux permease